MSEVKEDSQSKGMAEEANQGTADLNEGENTSNAIPSDDNMANEKRQQPHKVIPDAALSSESANPDARNDHGNMNQDVENTGLAEKKTLSQEEPSPDEDSMKNMDDKNYLSQAVVKNHDESEKESVTNKKQPIIEANSDDDHTGEQKASETTPSPVLDEQKHNESKEFLSTNAESKDGEDHIRKQKAQETTTLLLPNDKQEGQATLNEKSTATHTKSEDGEDHIRKQNVPETTTSPIPNDKQEGQAMLNEESTTTNDTNTESEDDVKNNSASVEPQDRQRSTALAQDMPVKKKLHGQVNDDEIIDHSDQEITGHTVTEIHGGNRRYLIAVGIVVIVAILVQYLRQPESLPQENDVRQIDIFLRQLEKLKTQFPNQRVELWHRSRIHLQRHLQTAQPTEPVSLILTAGLSAEKTLHCLAQGLASAFSSALNASVLHIDGASKADQDSDQVKLDIDRKLQGAFEGDKPVAIIHRFEELPPGSTLIFYRYCDHENAAYKKTFLIFTVLLGEEEEIPSKISLSSVEEMVDDHLQKKFLSHGHPVSFDMMDLDKYGGLWSRISHLILPVAAEKRIELEGC